MKAAMPVAVFNTRSCSAVLLCVVIAVTCRQQVVAEDELKYHLYDPSKFFGCQNVSVDNLEAIKHSIDYLFVRKMIEEGRNSVPPEEANVFVVPALMSQSAAGRCGDNSENVRNLIDVMESSPWFRRKRGADHFIVADNYLTEKGPSLGQLPVDWKIVFAHFECGLREINALTRVQRLRKFGYRSPSFAHDQQSKGCMPVGYSTYLALSKIAGGTNSESPPFKADELLPQRRHDVFFISGAITSEHKYAYHTRIDFICSWAGSSDSVKSRFFFHLTTLTQTDGDYAEHLCGGGSFTLGRASLGKADDAPAPIGAEMKISDAMKAMADSRFFLQIHGDTVTTDRLFNMFDTLTIPIVIDRELPHLLRQLPFNDGSSVPWRDLFVIIPSNEWKRNPAQSVLDAVDALTPADMEAKHRLLKLHAPDVSYAPDDTRAHKNLLAAAFKKMKSNNAQARD